MQNDNQNLADEMLLRELALPLIGKWVPFILLSLAQRAHNFSELHRTMTGVSRKVLTENLNNLQASGLISKIGETATGFPVTYQLTPLGESSLVILRTVKIWLRQNQEAIISNREQFEKTH
ncbi:MULTISPECIES: winged helix-turn-helix transcriptional regulator [Enterococcus]|uniref:Helix-turn-helix transcriptional regulator n=1 Tax=Enterococcus alishanensis TaxID=1303817 RepID=A0ABS6TD15_9ENTE|nr:helix-turn-helix transcriptional regulator [Enterococcus alishanensis]